MSKSTTFIEVYDDIIPIELQDYYENLVYSTEIPWVFQKKLSGVEGDKTSGFSRGLYRCNHLRFMINHDFLFKFLQVPYLLSSHLKLNILEIYNSRIFFMTPSPSSQTIYNGIHIDTDLPHYVCLYYINDSDGDTVFFAPDKTTEIKRITPKKGRVVFFTGNIFHCTSTPTQNRFILNTDFMVEEFGKGEKN